MLRKISFIGLILSSTWLVIPLFPGNIEKTKASIATLSRSEFSIEEKTLQRIDIDQSVAISYSPERNIDTDTEADDNPVIRQIDIINKHQQTNTDVVEGQQDHTRRVKTIQRFLSRWSGPAKYYAEEFVTAAELYGVDYRLVASISVVESGGCRHTFKPHNCWGWGRKTFSSYEEGIYTVTKGIATKYYARGLKHPTQIARVYAPPSTTWGANVTNLMSQMPK